LLLIVRSPIPKPLRASWWSSSTLLFETAQDGRIYIYKAGLLRVIENGWLEPHKSSTFAASRRLVRRYLPDIFFTF